MHEALRQYRSNKTLSQGDRDENCCFCTKPELDNEVDPFWPARWIVIYDTENGKVESIDNSENLNAVQGAGIKTAELVVEKDCQVVLTGHLA